MTHLFSEYRLKDVVLKNRIVVPPLGQYSAKDGVVQTWHMVNLGARAGGGAGLVIAECCAVSLEGRGTVGDAGLWDDKHAEAWKPIIEFVESQGAVCGVQLGH